MEGGRDGEWKRERNRERKREKKYCRYLFWISVYVFLKKERDIVNIVKC